MRAVAVGVPQGLGLGSRAYRDLLEGHGKRLGDGHDGGNGVLLRCQDIFRWDFTGDPGLQVWGLLVGLKASSCVNIMCQAYVSSLC